MIAKPIIAKSNNRDASPLSVENDGFGFKSPRIKMANTGPSELIPSIPKLSSSLRLPRPDEIPIPKATINGTFHRSS